MSVRRFVQQRDGELIEVGEDFSPELRASTRYVGDAHYDGLRAPDGTNISTRSKHREYMRRTGLTTIDDFAGHFTRAAEQRRRFFTEGHDPSRKRDIARAVHRAFDQAKGRR